MKFEFRQGTLKFKFNISNHRNFSVNLPIVFIYFYFVKINVNLQPGEPREHCLGEVRNPNLILYHLI